MKRNKKGTILILTMGIMIVCMLLPMITALIEDSVFDQKVVYNDMKTMQFSRNLSDVEKLFLLYKGNEATVDEEKTKLNSEDMKKVVDTALTPYKKAGMILGELDEFVMECEPHFYYSSTETNLSGIFWMIQLESHNQWRESMTIWMDDQSQKLMLFSYECDSMIFEENTAEEYLGWFSSIYMEQMDFGTGRNETIVYEAYNAEVPENYLCIQIRDVTYGDMELLFLIDFLGYSVSIE